MARTAFTWQEMEHWTLPQLRETLYLISEQEEADDFMLKYAEVCEDDDHALHNITYILGLSPRDEVEEVCDLFGVEYNAGLSPRQTFAESSLGVKS